MRRVVRKFKDGLFYLQVEGQFDVQRARCCRTPMAWAGRERAQPRNRPSKSTKSSVNSAGKYTIHEWMPGEKQPFGHLELFYGDILALPIRYFGHFPPFVFLLLWGLWWCALSIHWIESNLFQFIKSYWLVTLVVCFLIVMWTSHILVRVRTFEGNS